MIKDQAEFTKRLQESIEAIGRENAKILSAQITLLVQEIQSGASQTSNTFLLWPANCVPPLLAKLVSEQCQFAQWVLYIPDDATKVDLPMFGGLQKVSLDIPVGHLFAYCQPI